METLHSAATVPVAFTALLQVVPARHDGTTVFTFRVLFSEDPQVSFRVLRYQSFALTGGSVTRALRARDGNGVGRHDLREIYVKPTMALPPWVVTATDCPRLAPAIAQRKPTLELMAARGGSSLDARPTASVFNNHRGSTGRVCL